MKKALVVTSVASMVDQFLMPSIMVLKKMNYDVSVACNFENGSTCNQETIIKLKKQLKNINVAFYQVDFDRNIFHFHRNIFSFKQLKLILNNEKFDLVHCHSPIGGALTRLVCKRLRKTGLKVIYTAHGFHFYKGAPKKNWLLYYPVEKICSRWTDVLITINKEDYKFAEKHLKAKQIQYIPGVGISIEKFRDVQVNINNKRKDLDLPQNKFILCSVGELNINKNHSLIVNALGELQNPDIHYVIIGKGENKENIEKLAEQRHISDQVHLVGFREDIPEILKSVNAYVLPSIREGLNVSLMEAMASGLPVICGEIRGNVDLIDDEGGFLFDVNDLSSVKNAILSLFDIYKNFPMKFLSMSSANESKIADFGRDCIDKKMEAIYQ